MKLFGVSRVVEPEKHKYVRLIEFAMQDSSFSGEEACAASGMTEREFQFAAPSVFILSAFQEREGMTRTAQKQNWVLQPTAYFGYLQFVALQHATRTAVFAHWLAIVAIVVAILSGVLAIAG